MAVILKQSNGFSKKDIINSRNGLSYESAAGKKLAVTSAALMEKNDADGVPVRVSCINTADACYTGISSTMYSIVDELIDYLDDNGSVNIHIDKLTAKSGRDFCTLTIVD